MASLVADYGSESEEGEEEEERLPCVSKTEEVPEKLPSPKFLKDGRETQESGTRSVFSNPYREAEEAQKSLLEKHVKMTSVEKQSTLNGKQICWNFRKGKCRFGHNCKFAHDSDAPVDNRTNLVPSSATNGEIHDGGVKPKHKTKKSGKRPGLSDGLVPSKKVMKMYRQNANLSKV
ncbi:uncharacterized protein [Centruroides vittatus]|uniref:uncharacterized protein n=1 Tax=Centruroides vittatus TaxID=120091 RepID=UPI00351087A3